MKKNIKAIAFILSCLMVGSSIPAVFAAGGTGKKEFGDVNGDGVTNSKDLTRLMKYAAGVDVEIFDADLNRDGKINAKDLTRLMKYLARDFIPEPDDTTAVTTAPTSDPDVSETEVPTTPMTTAPEPDVSGTDVPTEPTTTAPDPEVSDTDVPTEPTTTAPEPEPETDFETVDFDNEVYPDLEPKGTPEDVSDLVVSNKSDALEIVSANKTSNYQIVCVGAANKVTSNQDQVSIKDFAQATHEYEVAVALQNTIRLMTGCNIRIVNDTARRSGEYADYEIIIGSTSRNDLFPEIDFTSYKGDSFEIVRKGNTVLLAAAENPRTEENLYQNYDLADGIWNAVDYFVKEYLKYDVSSTLVTPTATKGIKIDVVNYKYDDPYVTPGLKENTVIDGFDISQYGDIDYNKLMTHVAYANPGTDSPCYATLSTSNYNKILRKANNLGSLIYNTAADPKCGGVEKCEACRKAAEEEGTDMGAYFQMVKRAAAEVDAGNTVRILAANETYKAPKSYLGDNVEVIIYNPKLCSAHAVNDPSCETNAEFVKNVEAWKKVCGRVSVLDFTSDYYYFPVTFPNFYTMKQNIQWYKSEGMYAVYLQFDTTQSCLEFADLRLYLARVLLENPNMTDAEYNDFMISGLAHYYGAENAETLKTYIDRFTKEATRDGKCFNIYSEPAEILPMKTEVDGVEGYNTAFAKEAYKLWESVHPYNETLARNESYLARMISSRYQSSPVSHAKTQYQEWMMSVIDMPDKSWVLNRILNYND